MTEFLAELRRRHIFRIGGIYVVVAWGIAQVIDFLSQVFALPDWVAQPVAIVLAIGFPVVLIAAWIIIGAAKAGDTPAELKKATTTDWALIGAFAVVIVLIGYQRLSPVDSTSTTAVATSDAAASIAGDIVQDVAGKLPNSVAVLPFANVSPDPDDEYFAVGIHDEILNKLQSLQNLSVIARASVMKYADTAMTIPEIADELNVETIMSGSVRLAGDQVLVNAELIDGESNLTVWSDQYPGNLSDIFGIQADIAMNIANALRAEFSVEEQENIETPPTDSPAAYDAYLRAVELVRSSQGPDVQLRAVAAGLFDTATELDPEFALAFARKANLYVYRKVFDPVTEETWLEFSSEMDRLALENADKALELDPTAAFARLARAYVYLDHWETELLLSEADEALRLSPNDVVVLRLAALVESVVRERPDVAIQYAERMIELDPNESQGFSQLASALHLDGRYAEASEAARGCNRLAPTRTACLWTLMAAELVEGNRDAAINAARATEAIGGLDAPNTNARLAHGYGLLGLLDDARRVFEANQVIATNSYVDPGQWAWAYLGIGDYEGALLQLNRAVENRALIKQANSIFLLVHNYMHDPVLERPEFIDVRNKLRYTQ